MDISSLIDPRTGIIRRIEDKPIPDSLPREFRLQTAVLSDTTRFSPWHSDFSGAGYSLLDEKATLGPAIGEAIERYCGNLVPHDLPRTTYRALLRAGERALDPRIVVLFTEAQYSSPRFPFVPFTEDTELEWVRGIDLVTDQEVHVPANLVWISYAHAAGSRGVPFLNPVLSSGLAAGPDERFARWSALCQLIERDTLTMAWHGRSTLREIHPPSWLAALGKGDRNTLRTRFIEFPNEFGMIVAGALVFDEATGYLSMGAACRTTTESALRKALAEAFQLQMFVAALDDPHGPYMQAATNPESPLKPWRADRRYLDDYRNDFADVIEYCTHLQLFLDPRMQEQLNTELHTAIGTTVHWTDLDANTPLSDVDDPITLAHILDAAGHPVIVVDVTTVDVRPTGMRVVHALAPGMYSNSSVGLPFLGGTRLPAQLTASGQQRRNLPLPH